jgi:hypothetical protein
MTLILTEEDNEWCHLDLYENRPLSRCYSSIQWMLRDPIQLQVCVKISIQREEHELQIYTNMAARYLDGTEVSIKQNTLTLASGVLILPNPISSRYNPRHPRTIRRNTSVL